MTNNSEIEKVAGAGGFAHLVEKRPLLHGFSNYEFSITCMRVRGHTLFQVQAPSDDDKEAQRIANEEAAFRCGLT